jgi:CelD/BcsL family acetyltransferase involved in cellulose biosynthesis
VIADDDEFAALAQSWHELQQHAIGTSIFETFHFQHLWWKTYGKGRPLRVLVAMVGEAMVGILPLYVQTLRMMRYPVRLLRFVGNGGDTTPDDLGPILAAGHEASAARTLADAILQMPDWDVLHLPDMSPACPFTTGMAEAATRARLKTFAGRAERIAYLKLPPAWDDFLESLSSHRRKRIRYIRRRADTLCQARFFIWDDRAKLAEAFDRLAYLHHKRWDRAGKEHKFSSPEYLAFHRSLMDECMSRDQLRLYCLELSGQIAAMQYCYRFRNAVYVMQTGFDPDFSDAGQILLTQMIESAIGEGNSVLDFLRGEHSYKEQFPSCARETVFLTALRNNPGAWAYRMRRQYMPKVKARLLDAVKSLGLVASEKSSSAGR